MRKSNVKTACRGLSQQSVSGNGPRVRPTSFFARARQRLNQNLDTFIYEAAGSSAYLYRPGLLWFADDRLQFRLLNLIAGQPDPRDVYYRRRIVCSIERATLAWARFGHFSRFRRKY